jgi:hypothetical protein
LFAHAQRESALNTRGRHARCGAAGASGLRFDPLTHATDRVCLGRCYRYANYEPFTAQFRIRAIAENPIVMSNYTESWMIQAGVYQVKDRDLPLYQVVLDRTGHVFIRQLQAGAQFGMAHSERARISDSMSQ